MTKAKHPDKREPELKQYPIEWWESQSHRVAGQACPKCHSLTRGEYIPPSPETMVECAVVECCVTCGWSHTHITGRARVPYETQPTNPRSALKVVGTLVEERRDVYLPINGSPRHIRSQKALAVRHRKARPPQGPSGGLGASESLDNDLDDTDIASDASEAL